MSTSVSPYTLKVHRTPLGHLFLIKCQTISVNDDHIYRQSKSEDPFAKFFLNRNTLFPNFDSGFVSDYQSFFSITPRCIAAHMASSLPEQCKVVADLGCGVGGNSIAFALSGRKVVSADIDPAKISGLLNNARVAGISPEMIQPFLGSWEGLPETGLKVDFALCSPPWGGMDYRRFGPLFNAKRDIPCDFMKILEVLFEISGGCALILPRNTDLEDLANTFSEIPENLRMFHRTMSVIEYRINSRPSMMLVMFGNTYASDMENQIELVEQLLRKNREEGLICPKDLMKLSSIYIDRMDFDKEKK